MHCHHRLLLLLMYILFQLRFRFYPFLYFRLHLFHIHIYWYNDLMYLVLLERLHFWFLWFRLFDHIHTIWYLRLMLRFFHCNRHLRFSSCYRTQVHKCRLLNSFGILQTIHLLCIYLVIFASIVVQLIMYFVTILNR